MDIILNLRASLKFPELKESSSLAEKSDGAQPPSVHTKDAADTHSQSPMRPTSIRSLWHPQEDTNNNVHNLPFSGYLQYAWYFQAI